MKHKFRKYISNRGSALFMVLSVMTSLIVTTMAMYFSVVSSRKTQYAIFNQQQSYQSALSLSESLLGGIIAGTDDANKTGFNALAQAVSNMSVGETITTSGNGFSSFDAAGGTKIDEDQVGAYIADITFLSETEEGRLFDFAVTTMVNGTESTVHQYVLIPASVIKPPPSGGGGVPERLFTSSGLVPSNSSIGGGAMFCDVFYDTEYAFMMPYGNDAQAHNSNGAHLQYMGNVYAAGSLEMNMGVEKTAEQYNWAGLRPIEWVIRNDFVLSNETHRTSFPSDGMLSGTTYSDKTNRIIVGGDMIVKSDSRGVSNVDIYVLGDLYLDGTDFTNKFGSSVRIFCNGNIFDENGYIHPGFSGVDVYQFESNWSSASSNPHQVISAVECVTRIHNGTTSITYYDWNTAYESIPGVNDVKNLNLQWCNPTYLVWSPESQGCTINSISATGGGGGSSDSVDEGYKIIIDTGDDPNNTYTIKLNGYLDGGKTFSWFPRKEETNMFVFVRGPGSVVFEVQPGVTYANWSNRTLVMHEDWVTSLGMSGQSSRDNVADIKSFVHWDCGEDCATCKHEAVQLSASNPENLCKICQQPKYKVECTRHAFNKYLCKDCEKDYYKFVEEGGKVYSVGTCGNRIDYNSTGSAHPTVNIYLVACSPQSDIEFTWPDTKTYSNFWGYIYAPYVTLSFNGKVSSGETLTFVGGIAVADFKMSGFNTYVGVYPDKLPSELMSKKCLEHPLPGIDNKPWKQEI